MKIEVKAGQIVRITRRRSTSVRGGVYEFTPASEADRDRIAGTKGVTVLERGEDSEERFPALAKHDLTLADAAGMSDEELLALDGLGKQTLAGIRKAGSTTEEE